MKITRAVVPSLFTVLNMFCGFLSLIHSSAGDYVSASWFIILAAGFDAFDGIMARITKSSSEFGVQIDSLSDVVSFGAAPAFLVYRLSLSALGSAGVLLSSLVMIFGGLRLARFNVQLTGFDKEYFKGLPIPASAITLASFTLNFYPPGGVLHPVAAALLPYMVVGLSLLMVSKVRYDTLPRISRRAIRREPWKFLFAVLAVIVVVVTGGSAVFPLLLLFIALGIVRHAVNVVRRWTSPAAKYEDEQAVEPSSIDT
ncbi:MAG TPA: CDP-diacylglycerol--serine O-phosphatidyltransferase [Bacteroidota bacterium]|nr:CDP-diacylglycerol--serine O-phosphatidyltransferase [Bacteroidota bacterium]